MHGLVWPCCLFGMASNSQMRQPSMIVASSNTLLVSSLSLCRALRWQTQKTQKPPAREYFQPYPTSFGRMGLSIDSTLLLSQSFHWLPQPSFMGATDGSTSHFRTPYLGGISLVLYPRIIPQFLMQLFRHDGYGYL